jgi:hypothetical protein
MRNALASRKRRYLKSRLPFKGSCDIHDGASRWWLSQHTPAIATLSGRERMKHLTTRHPKNKRRVSTAPFSIHKKSSAVLSEIHLKSNFRTSAHLNSISKGAAGVCIAEYSQKGLRRLQAALSMPYSITYWL